LFPIPETEILPKKEIKISGGCMEYAFFLAFGTLAVLSGLMVIVSKNPVHSTLFLILTLFCVAGIFVLLNAHFLAAIQIMVYAGAIMVLFLFVVMLLNLKELKGEFEKLLTLKIMGIGAAAFFLAEVVFLIFKGSSKGISGSVTAEVIAREGNTVLIGKLLFTKYLLPFEATSVLLLVAIIGAVILAKRKID
jgi:NADH-quinone oxidoreductase subunit J